MDHLNLEFKDLFNDMPVILPYARSAPINFPVIYLKSVDNKYKCSISKSTIDFSLFPTEVVEDYSEIEDLFNRKADSIVKAVNNFRKVKIIRIGFVLNYFYPNENPVSKIIDTY